MRGRSRSHKPSPYKAQCFHALRKLEADYLFAMFPPEITPDEVVAALLPKDYLSMLKTCFPLVSPTKERSQCPLHFKVVPPGHVPPVVKLDVDFSELKLLTPADDLFETVENNLKPGPVIEALMGAVEMATQFAAAHEILEWFDRNDVSLAAARYYWPAICTLAPDETAHLIKTPERFKEPNGISALLPKLRATHTLIASAVLLPGGKPKPSGIIRLWYEYRTFDLV